MSVIYILWLRQVRRYVRSKSRVIGAIGQPLLFLLALGYGIGSLYQRANGGSYIEFLVPGVVVQTILFGGIFWGINIIWDKQFGFLKETLVAPVPRLKILLGSALGGATTTLFQALLVLVISLFIGFHPYNWWLVAPALLVMMLFSVAVTSFSAGIASVVNDFQGFQAINQFLIFPLFFLSGALFPLEGLPPVLKVIVTINPVSYVVDALRALLINQSHFGLPLDLAVLAGVIIVTAIFGARRFRRIES